MKRVLFYMPNFHHGGAEGIMVDVANYFVANELEVIFVVVKADGVLKNQLDKNIKIIDLNLKNQWFSILKLPLQIKRLKPDYIFSTMKESNFIAIFSKILAFSNSKNIIREANTVSQQINKEDKAYQKIKNKIIFFFYKFAYKIIVLSKSMGNDLLSISNLAKDKLVVIPNFVNMDKINVLIKEEIENQELFLFEKSNTFISVSRLFPQKNYFFLLDGLKEFKEKNNNFTFIALGDGPQKEELQEYTKKLGLESHCYFLGYKSNPYKYLAKSDAFILPSLYEGMSNSLIQAMALNLKVLVSDSQPISLELIENYDNGTSYSAGDIENFLIMLNVVSNSNKTFKDKFQFDLRNIKLYLEVIN